MENVEKLKKIIETYDRMIEELVIENAPDKIIGNLELKRQTLINRCKKIEANNTSTIVVNEEVQIAGQSDNFKRRLKIVNKLNEKIEIYDHLIYSMEQKNKVDNDEDVNNLIIYLKNEQKLLMQHVKEIINASTDKEFISILAKTIQ